MAASIITIADALVIDLNAGTFSQSFVATRRYRPLYEEADLRLVQVTVVPKSIATESFTRGSNSYEEQIDLAVQKRASLNVEGEPDHTEMDALMALVEEIMDFCRDLAYGDARCIARRNEPIWAPEHLKEKHVFTSVITLTFQVIR